MREYRSYGSVRGAPGNRRLYRDPSFRIASSSGSLVSVILREAVGEVGETGGFPSTRPYLAASVAT